MIVKSNRQPNTTRPAKPCPEVPHLHVFWTPPGMVTPPIPWWEALESTEESESWSINSPFFPPYGVFQVYHRCRCRNRGCLKLQQFLIEKSTWIPWEVMGTNWNTEGSTWTSGNISLLWGWLSSGTGCPWRLPSLHPRRYSEAKMVLGDRL